MSVWEEISLVARHELRKNLRSVKGIVMFVLFLLGGAVPALIMILVKHAENVAHVDKIDPEQQRQIFERSLYGLYHDHATATYLSYTPGVLFFLFYGTLMFLPLLSIIIGFDMIAGEVQHRSIRYLAGRVQRSSIVVGKALGMWGVVSVMMLVLHATVWIVMIVRGDDGVGETLSWGLRFWVFCVAAAGATTGFTALMSSLFRVPILALFVSVCVAFAMWVGRTIILAISFRYDSVDPAKYIFPASYETLMISPQVLTVVGGCAAAVAWGVAVTGLTVLIVQRKDV